MTCHLGRKEPEASNETASTHPIFETPLGGTPFDRPAIKIEVKDDWEGLFHGTAELYLRVQSGRFPSQVSLLFPVNRGDFEGCAARFIQLPFEVRDGDNLIFNLIDNDKLSVGDEQRILNACRIAGYCLAIGAEIYQPQVGRLLRPAFRTAAQVLGDQIVLRYQNEPFKNVGVGTFIVQSSRPRQPNEANPLSLKDGNYVRADVRIYYPELSDT